LGRKPKFFDTNQGKLVQYRKRERQRVHVLVDDLEPQSKKMPEKDRDRFQVSVVQQLTNVKRKAFRGPIALKIDLSTTSMNAPQAHTITKNILDLLAARRPSVAGRSAHLLYKDDSQIQALAVSCRHGQDHPMISIEGRPFSSMLQDIELATDATREMEMDNPGSWNRDEHEQEWVHTLKDLLRNQVSVRKKMGDALYDAYVRMCRWSAQRALLSRSGIDVPKLCWLYDRPKCVVNGFAGVVWTQLVSSSTLRLQIGELPIAPGSSQSFRQRIVAEIAKFKTNWDWLIEPLVIAVALEVVVRPSPSTPAAVLHDLDNIVRDYLLPKIVPSFDTVTDHIWRIDFEELRRTNPDLAARWGPNPTPPKGTRAGVTRYEAWRLPPALDSAGGFVSVALVADMDGEGDLIQQADDKIRRWSDILKRESRESGSHYRF
jgi:hypothetical protein